MGFMVLDPNNDRGHKIDVIPEKGQEYQAVPIFGKDKLLAVILEFNMQNLVTIPGYHTATDFFRPQLPRDLGIRQGHPAMALFSRNVPRVPSSQAFPARPTRYAEPPARPGLDP
jgi:hypothetical protein